MKITIETSGDRSVGIPPEMVTIDWLCMPNEFLDEEGRPNLVKHLKAFWKDWLDFAPEYLSVSFEDQCPDCGKPMTGFVEGRNPGRCTNPKCPVNLPDDEECKHSFSVDLEYDSSGNTCTCEHCGAMNDVRHLTGLKPIPKVEDPAYYLVEHRSRGVFMGMKEGKPKCSYSALRSAAGVHKFYTREAAEKVRDKIKGSYLLSVWTKEEFKVRPTE